eukprot:TRINITY_DN32934_c0_g1_i1.p1 TRINITY_DN32934_c0_g1~~TRINITY_DN32934_c0_g1_i1.p1  ORF type:complete len:283 (+),score=60.12 TRINITY_DN32934_c0_g1_i1:56-904(+)
MGNASSWARRPCCSVDHVDMEVYDWVHNLSTEVSFDEVWRDSFIIFDWDDTLMCSSDLKAKRQLTPVARHLLGLAVEQLLRTAMALGRTVIVTNANLPWVEASAREVMPSILPLLTSMQIVSARQSYEGRWPGDCGRWKREAFRDVLAHHYDSVRAGTKKGNSEKDLEEEDEEEDDGALCAAPLPLLPWLAAGVGAPPPPMNLVVLGDSTVDIQAGKTALRGCHARSSLVKTVKFKALPSAEELLGQLDVVLRSLHSLVEENRSLNKKLVHRASLGWGLSEA